MDQFKADERLWKRLEPKRRLRRKLRPLLTPEQRKKLDLLEFAKARPQGDCIGEWIERGAGVHQP